MKISCTINTVETLIEADADERLITTLRRLGYISVKNGCLQGKYGSCTILLDNLPVSSCLLYTGSIQNNSIVTLEHFMKTPDYDDIAKAFSQTGIKLCGFCNAGKYFTAFDIITKNERPAKDLIEKRVSHLLCKCVDNESLIHAVLLASKLRIKRLSGAAHGKR